MGLQRVTITAWLSSLMTPRESRGFYSWAASPEERERKSMRESVTASMWLLGASL